MITEDCFLPTYYSIKYEISYKYNTEINERDDFSELINKMVIITDYHYPYLDYKFDSSGWYFNRPYSDINSLEMSGFYKPLTVSQSPNKEKLPDIIPNNQKIPELQEIIYLIEQFFASNRLKNKNTNDDEFYKLVFTDKIDDAEIKDYISNHITIVDGIEINHNYIKE